MNQYGTPSTPSQLGVRPATALQNTFLSQAFLWMFAGLLLTAGVAFLLQTNASLLNFAYRNWLLLAIGQIALAIGIQAGLRRMSATLALGLFFVYAASIGLTVGIIVQAYTGTSVVAAFLTASAMFGGAAIYGKVTHRSLMAMGAFLYMAFLGLFVAIIVNLFLASSAIGFVISIVGVVIFTGLTAYDVQRIQSGDYAAAFGSVEKAAVFGALHLYIDFVNLFLFILRLTGSRR
jgi:FtsH-binding integral membrane protein